MAEIKTWEAMRERSQRLLVDRTGQDLYVTLVSTRREFAHIRATTKTRIDLGLRLPGAAPGGRLVSAKVLNDDVMTVRIPLTAPDEVDDEVIELLRTAHAENS